MKKSILIFVLIFAFGIMSGCGKTENNKPGEKPENTNQPSTDISEEYVTKKDEALCHNKQEKSFENSRFFSLHGRKTVI